MQKLLHDIEKLKTSPIKLKIDQRIKEFERVGLESSHEIFSELSFCLLTAHFNAEKSIKIQNSLGTDGFLSLKEEELVGKLKEFGHRFPEARARYIINARRYGDNLKDIIQSFDDEGKLREWVIKNIKGLGNKESSHFLRNIGYKNIAIIDFHIIDLLVRYGLIERPKSLTKKKYLEIEELLKRIADRSGLTVAELDLYLWYMETGKVLK